MDGLGPAGGGPLAGKATLAAPAAVAAAVAVTPAATVTGFESVVAAVAAESPAVELRTAAAAAIVALP